MSTAGSSGTALSKKLGIREGSRSCALAAPRGWTIDSAPPSGGAARLGAPGLAIDDLSLGATIATSLAGRQPFDVIVAFCAMRAGGERGLPRWRTRMTPAAGLRLAWPKRAANIITDMTEQVALPTGLVDHKVCAIDEVCSGLRLVIRTELRS